MRIRSGVAACLLVDALGVPAGGEFSVAQQRTRHHRTYDIHGYKIQHPKTIPDTAKKQREADLASQAHGEVQFCGTLWTEDDEGEVVEGSGHLEPLSVSGVDEAMDGGDPTKVRRFLQRLKPWLKGADGEPEMQDLSDAQLVAALNQRDGDRCNRLHIGVEREILTEQSSANPVRRWCRFLDPRALAVQWVLLNVDRISGTDDTTIKLAMEPWMDGTTIGGHPCVGGSLTFRPVDCDALPAEPNPRPRICLYADDTRETREVYELLVRIFAAQMFAACSSDLKVTVGGREITVQLQVESIRGDYHAQQAWNGLFMSGRWKCPFAFVPQEEYGNFSAFCTQIEKKIAEKVPGVAEPDSLAPAQIKGNLKHGLQRLDDYYEYAQRLAESKRDADDAEGEEGAGRTGTTYDEVDLGYVKIGGKDSQVFGPAPWAVNLRSTGADGRELTLERHGVKNSNLAPDPEHCLMVRLPPPSSLRRPLASCASACVALRRLSKTSSLSLSASCHGEGQRSPC